MNRTEKKGFLEKIAVKKSNGVYRYTGYISEYDKDNILIRTIRGETLIFRKEQIDERQIIEPKGTANGKG